MMRYQYTIEGKIITGPGIDDSAGYLSKLGISVGSNVSFTFMIDLSAQGFIRLSDGAIKPAPFMGSFYSRYVAGTTLTIDTYISSLNNIAEQNYGNPNWLTLHPSFGERYIDISNGNNYLQISDMKEQPDSKDCWLVGSNFGCRVMINTIYDASGNKSMFAFEAKISQADFAPT